MRKSKDTVHIVRSSRGLELFKKFLERSDGTTHYVYAIAKDIRKEIKKIGETNGDVVVLKSVRELAEKIVKTKRVITW